MAQDTVTHVSEMVDLRSGMKDTVLELTAVPHDGPVPRHHSVTDISPTANEAVPADQSRTGDRGAVLHDRTRADTHLFADKSSRTYSGLRMDSSCQMSLQNIGEPRQCLPDISYPVVKSRQGVKGTVEVVFRGEKRII